MSADLVQDDATLAPEAEFALACAQRSGVRFVRLWFVDVLGLLKSIVLPVSELRRALENGVGFDGAALDGAFRDEGRDMVAVPDPRTFQILPWSRAEPTARMFCNIESPDGRASPGDSRAALARVVAQAHDLGLAPVVGAQVEFYVFAAATGGRPPEPLDQGSYFETAASDASAPFCRRAIEHLEQMGIPVRSAHHEASPSQYAIALQHADAIAFADAITTFRVAVKEAAIECGAFATFMPKPRSDHEGSGLHLHLSLFDGAENLFHDPDPDVALSPLGRSFLAGVLAHARELTALTNQWTNSYRRLIRGFAAPDTTRWGLHDRTALVRVPARRPGHPGNTRLVLRSPDPGCNAHLALACVLAAGMRGIERGYELPPPDEPVPSPPALPRDLREAVDAMDESELVRDTLGDRLVEVLLQAKREALEAERAIVTRHERATLLKLL